MYNKEFKVVTLNVNGLTSPIKRGKMISKVKREKAQIIFWQETHLTNQEHEKIKKMGFRHTYYSSCKTGRRRGVAILLPNSVHFELLSETKDKDGRFVMVKGKIDQQEVTLLNVYAPQDGDRVFYKKIFDLIAFQSAGVLICAGDFNMILNPCLDTTNSKRKLTTSERWIKKRIGDLGLIDVWRHFHDLDKQFTFYSSRHKAYSRIDYIFMHCFEIHRLKECEISPRVLSDHSSVYLKLHLTSRPKSTAWRLNISMLNSPGFKQRMKVELQTYLEVNDNGSVNPVILWDAAKAVLRGKIISETAFVKKVKAQRLLDLQKQLSLLEQQHTQSKEAQLLLQMRPIKQEIDKIYSDEVEKKLRFTKQRYYEAGSKASKLLAWRLRKQQSENAIYKIKDPVTKQTTCDLVGIQEAFEKYYQSLYSQSKPFDSNKAEEFLSQLDLPSLGKVHNDRLMQEITTEEIDRAISSLKSCKSPGIDGFPGEWYKAMREQLVPMLHKSFNYTLQEGVIPPSWREAAISVIPKEGKDLADCGSYRPISVLNQDYKIYVAILTKRMEEVMPLLIDEDQCGFIKGRQTQDCIRRTLHTIEYIKKEGLGAILLSMDAEKAFDSVGWEFLYKAMEKFGFDEKFIKSIRTLYTSPTARIKVNGGLSRTICLQRGCRQGCPASPGLFNLFIEPLAQAIRQDPDLEGISIRGTEYRLCLFADDLQVSLINPECGVPRLMDLLQKYGALSGYTLNIGKTQALVFNFIPTPDLKNKYKFNWDSTSMKYLGVKLTKDIPQIFTENYTVTTTKLKEDLDRWASLPLDIGNRIMTVKTNILPRLLYFFQSLPIHIPDSQFREWDRAISRFIWNGRPPRVRYKTLQLPRGSGGMGLPCLKDYYLSAQIRPLLLWCNQEYYAKWKVIELSLLDRPLQSLLGHTLATKYLDIQSQWVRHSIETWFGLVKKLNIQDEIRILTWPIYDPDFKPAVNDGGFTRWARNGITALCKLIENQVLIDFETMSGRYDLGRQDFYRYLQFRHFFDIKVKGSLSNTVSGITQMFIRAYESRLTGKIIGELYRCIVELRGYTTDYVKEKWQSELGVVIAPEDWINIFNCQSTTTASQQWRDFSWKNCIRFFRTPKQTAKQTGLQPKCWRDCGCCLAGHAHVFWDCPVLKSFWDNVHNITRVVLGYDIDFTCSSFYLGNIDLEISKSDRYLLKIFMVSSKKAITRRWLRKEPPTTNEWESIVNDIRCTELMTFSLRLQKDKGIAFWGKWDSYLKQRGDNLFCI